MKFGPFRKRIKASGMKCSRKTGQYLADIVEEIGMEYAKEAIKIAALRGDYVITKDHIRAGIESVHVKRARRMAQKLVGWEL